MKRHTLATLLVLSSPLIAQQDQKTELEILPDDTKAMTWDSVTGRTYFMQWSTDLISWSYFPRIEYGDGTPSFSYGFDSNADKLFTRLHYTDQATSDALNDDFDLDGVSNIDEVTTLGGTNPFDGDSDGDGKSDWQEFAEGLDPQDGQNVDTSLNISAHSGTRIELPQSLTAINPTQTLDVTLQGAVVSDGSYTVSHSKEVNGPAFNWIEISTTGEELDFQGNNTRIVSRPLSFSFDLYENTYNQLSISYKGFVSGAVLGEFDGATQSFDQELPNASNAPASLCLKGIPYSITATGKVYFQEFVAVAQDPAYAVVQWQDVALNIGGGNFTEHTFQAVIYEDGKIQFNYQLIPDIGGAYVATFHAGIQNEAKDKGSTAYYYDGEIQGVFIPQESPITVEFNRGGGGGSVDWLTVSPTQITGDPLNYQLDFTSIGQAIDTYGPVSLKLTLNPEGTEVFEQFINFEVLDPATNGDDILTGSIGNDLDLNGLYGDDQITSFEGDDDVNGGFGRDTIDGGAGSDTLTGEAGNDLYILRQGEGLDTISETSFDKRDVIRFEDLYWEDLTITFPTASQMLIHNAADQLADVRKGGDYYPALQFPDGLQADWDTDTDSYVLLVNRSAAPFEDTNSNGLEDWYERLLFGSLVGALDGTDANVPTPNGIPDWWEIHYFGSLQPGDGDFDNDGLLNSEEWTHMTDPTEVDTDGDGLSDKYEVDATSVDPLVDDADFEDADGDGLFAYQEAQLGTSDNDPDHDGDNINDGVEFLAGTNPSNDDSYPFDYTRYLGPDLTGTGIPNIGRIGINYTFSTRDNFLRLANVHNFDHRFPGDELDPLVLLGSGETQRHHSMGLKGRNDPLYSSTYLDGRRWYHHYYEPFGGGVIDPSQYSEEATFPAQQLPVGSVGNTVVLDRSRWLILSNGREGYFVPFKTSSWADSYGGSDIVGPMYRKIGLNGRPIPDSQPQEEGESDMASEQTYVDAFSLSLHHDNSFVYTPLGASDLTIEANASVRETIWNNRGGLRPEEELTSPFGVCWSSNLCSYVEIVETRGQLTNTPQAVTVIDENGRPQRFGTTEDNEYFPWPSTAVDKKTYLNTLEKDVNGNFVLQKKYGNTLVYEPCDAWFMYSTDRLDGSNVVNKHNYWRLVSVTDKYGVTVNYNYGSSNVALIPESITCPQRPNQGLAIGRSTDMRRIESITDARGNTTYFDYNPLNLGIGGTSFSYPVQRLYQVRYPDGTTTGYTYEPAVTLDNQTSTATYYIHMNVKTITDKRNYTHSFDYVPDWTKRYFTASGSGKLDFNTSIDDLPSYYRRQAQDYIDSVNEANFPSNNPADYHFQYGLPRLVSKVTLPDGIGEANFAKTSDTQSIYGPQFSALSKTEVSDAEGNKTCYDFKNVDAVVVNRAFTYSGSGSSYAQSWMVYYPTMEIHHGNWESETGYLGKETFEFDPEAGMALERMVDFSGNETTWEYANNYSDNVTTPFATTSTFFTKWADPTSMTDALGRVESYRYSDNFRIMDQKTDVYGTVTTHSIDSLGRSTGMTVVDKDSNKLREETYQYTEATLPAFKTKSIVEAFSNLSGQSWETDLVTQFVPNLTNGMVKDVIQDPDGFAYTSSYLYDNNNNKTSSTDGRGNTTGFIYDALNRLTRVDYPVAGTSSGNVASYKEVLYDFNGNKAAERDEEGNYVFYHRDALNRVTDTIIDMDGAGLPTKDANDLVPDTSRGSIGAADIVSSVTYNDVNSPVTSTDPRGVVTRTVYDAIQRPTDIYTDDLGSGTVAASSTKTHTQLFYEDSLSINGVQYDANPGISAFSAGGFKPTRKVRNDAVLTDTGLASFTTYQVYDGLYRPLREVAQYDTNAGSFAANHRTTVTAYGAISGGKEALNRSVTDDRGKVTRSVMDGLGRTTSVTDGFGSTLPATSTTTYSSTGLAWKTIDPLNRESETEFDAVGRASKVWSPDPISGVVNKTLSANGLTGSPMTETQYDANSNVVKTINPLDFEWDFTFDARNRKTDEYQPAVTDAENPDSPVLNQRPHIQIAYNGVSKPISTTDARDNTTRNFYDRAHRVTDVITNPVTGNPSSDPNALSANDILVETFYDKSSNVLTVVDGNGNITRNGYDALNRLVATAIDPVDGDPVDPSSGSFNAATYQGSSANDDIVVTNAYDDASNLILVTDGEGHSTGFRYDGLSRKTHTLWDVGTAVERVEYSAFDGLLLTAMTNPKLETTGYFYDDLHRLEDVTYIGRSQDDRHMDYDLVGNLLAVSYPNETVANQAIRGCAQTYDKLNRVATETSNGVTHTNTYDRAGNLRTLTYGQTNRVITSVYDALNRLDNCSEAVGAATPRVTSYAYNLNGGVTRKTLPNSSYTDCVFDALNRKTSITNRLGNGTQIQRSVTEYDDQSNVIRLEEYTNSGTADQITVMLNDRAYRLDTETRTEGATVTLTDYGYDKGNNRTSKSVSVNGATAQVSNYQFGTTSDGFNSNQLKSYNRPSTSDSVSFTYDANGNRLTRTIGSDTDDYGYDYNNRLVSLDLETSSDASKNGLYEYQYDHRTRRVLRDESSAGSDATRVVFSGGLSVQEVDEVGGSYDLTSPSVEYVRGSDYGGGIGGVLYTLRGGNSSFNYYNHRGDVLLKTNDAGVITWEARYEAFGTRTHEIGSNLDRQKANTKDEDPTGLLNEGMRYRDLESGVFITRDPAGFVDGPNVYTYVNQNPWSAFDPLGLNKKKLYRPKFWTGKNLWIERNTKANTSVFKDANKINKFNGAFARVNPAIVGTRKHGFIDIGHTRHNMDRTLSFYIQLSNQIRKSGSVPKGTKFESHANRDQVDISTPKLDQVPTMVEVTAKNLVEVSAQMAVAESNIYEDSTKGTKSYYSTEDLPSNKLGIDIAANHLEGKPLGYRPTVEEWGDAMDAGLNKALKSFEPLSRKESATMFNDYHADVYKKTKGKNKTDKPIIFDQYEKKK